MYSRKYTLGEFRDIILKLLQRYSSNGTIYPSGEKADIENRLMTSLNVHLARLWHEFSGAIKRQNLVMLVPECAISFGNTEISEGESITKVAKGKNMGFYMTVSGKGTIILNAGGASREYVADTLPGERVLIRGALTAREETEYYITIRSETGLSVHDFALFYDISEQAGEHNLLFGNGACAAYIPKDCSEIIAVYDRSGRRIRKSELDILEEDRIMVVRKNIIGECTIEYVPYPPAFSESDGGDEIYVSPLLADALSYMCAADLCPVHETELYSKLTYKYREILENLYTRRRQNSVVNKFYGIVRKRGVLPTVNGG